jgi:hypothetical protein
MGVDEQASADSIGANELTPEQARIKRNEFLAFASTCKQFDEADPADSGLATFILPGD